VRDRPPLVPVTVRVRVPRVVFELVETVSVEPVAVGLNEADERFGSVKPGASLGVPATANPHQASRRSIRRR
jgi:hypothetical protein